MEAKVANTDTSPDTSADNFSFGSSSQPADMSIGDQTDTGAN